MRRCSLTEDPLERECTNARNEHCKKFGIYYYLGEGRDITHLKISRYVYLHFMTCSNFDAKRRRYGSQKMSFYGQNSALEATRV